MTPFFAIFPKLLHLVEVHWPVLLALAVAVWAIVLIYRTLVTHLGPADLTGSGITIGAPKLFDNRSLTLMIEGLNTNLQSFNVVSQSATPSPGSFQQGESVSSSSRLQFAGLATAKPSLSASSAHTGDRPDGTSSDTNLQLGGANSQSGDKKAGSPAPFNYSPTFGMGAPDVLGDQLNLTYQIFNQRIVNERALSDRVYGEAGRRQIVLGFQVSIDPPEGSEDCAAVAEIGLDFDGSDDPISIVALIPQEKTYNVASVSSRGSSIDGSVVSRVMAIGGSASRQSDRLYLHRDADTIAFERDPAEESGAFGLRTPKEKQPATVFGWEFHPVLGRRTVTPGSRLMLAVIALPCADDTKPVLKVRTRAYWLTYNRKCQTTNVRWAWWPFPGRQGRVPGWTPRRLDLLSDRQIAALAPQITKISWVDAGAGSAVILVEGRNFFSGTEVVISGKCYHDKDSGLILKSDQALQVHTTIEALGQGNAVLNGRYGASIELAYPESDLPAKGINLAINFQILASSSELQPLYAVISANGGGPLLLEDLRKLPDPILYVNDHPLPRPYVYQEWSTNWTPLQRGPTPEKDPIDAVRVLAWVELNWLKSGAVLLFKIPFCGTDWATLTVLESSESILRSPVDVMRLGSDGSDSTLVIFSKTGFPDTQLTARFDKEYPLPRINAQNLLLSVPSTVLASYSKFILNGDAVNLLLDVPRDAGTAPTPPQTGQ